MDAHWWWLAAAVLLAVLEIVAPGVFLIWLAAAALLTGLATLAFGLGLPFQIVLFGLFSIASVLGGRRWYERHPVGSSDPMLNDRTMRLVGETVVVVSAIEGGRGRVQVGDGVWPAQGPDAGVGARMRVTGADGTCLRVEALMIPDGTGSGAN